MKNSERKAKVITAFCVIVLGFLIFIWANVAKDNSTRVNSSYLKKIPLKIEVSKGEEIDKRKTRFNITATGLKDISKIHFKIICKDTNSEELVAGSSCNKVETSSVVSDKGLAEVTAVFWDYNFKKDTGNKIKIIASNYDFAGVPISDEAAISQNNENYYSGEAEFEFNKSIPEEKAILQGKIDNYSKISIGMTLADIDSFYAMSKICDKYAEGESSFGNSFMYKCSLGGKYAHFSFYDGKLSSKQILNF